MRRQPLEPQVQIVEREPKVTVLPIPYPVTIQWPRPKKVEKPN
jgi:hypothetical protein